MDTDEKNAVEERVSARGSLRSLVAKDRRAQILWIDLPKWYVVVS